MLGLATLYVKRVRFGWQTSLVHSVRWPHWEKSNDGHRMFSKRHNRLVLFYHVHTTEAMFIFVKNLKINISGHVSRGKPPGWGGLSFDHFGVAQPGQRKYKNLKNLEGYWWHNNLVYVIKTNENWADISKKQTSAQFLGGASNDKLFSKVERANINSKFPLPEVTMQIIGEHWLEIVIKSQLQISPTHEAVLCSIGRIMCSLSNLNYSTQRTELHLPVTKRPGATNR